LNEGEADLEDVALIMRKAEAVPVIGIAIARKNQDISAIDIHQSMTHEEKTQEVMIIDEEKITE
jgi:hypothetical protein